MRHATSTNALLSRAIAAPVALVRFSACGLLAVGTLGASVAMASGAAHAVADPVPTATAAVSRTKAVAQTQPEWKSLTPSQQAALAPLAPHWAGITEAQKRKWVEISRNFGTLPAAEQQRMHARMSEWVSLSNRERAQARLNYADVKALPPEARREQWQAYQALSPEQKQKLAAQATPTKPLGAAVPPKPVAPGKLAVTAAAPALGAGKANATAPLPKIVTAPKHVTPTTLLPKAPVAPEAPQQAHAPAAPHPAPTDGGNAQ